MTSEASFPRLTGSADASVRPARPADAADIARIQLVTWRTAYRSVLPAAVLDEWDDDASDGDEDALRGEGADADVAAGDLHGGGAIG